MNRRAALLILFAAAGTIGTPPAFAQLKGLLKLGARGAARAAGRSATTNDAVLSRDELRSCVANESTIAEIGGELDRAERNLEIEGGAIDRLGARIDAEEPFVDETNRQAVDAFNALLDQHDSAVDLHNSKVARHVNRVDSFNARVDSFNLRCADAQYYESDMQAIRAGR